jgi:hypothetical protein
MLANGDIKDLSEGREIIHNSSLVETFDPEDPAPWAEAKLRFAAL